MNTNIEAYRLNDKILRFIVSRFYRKSFAKFCQILDDSNRHVCLTKHDLANDSPGKDATKCVIANSKTDEDERMVQEQIEIVWMRRRENRKCRIWQLHRWFDTSSKWLSPILSKRNYSSVFFLFLSFVAVVGVASTLIRCHRRQLLVNYANLAPKKRKFRSIIDNVFFSPQLIWVWWGEQCAASCRFRWR